MKKPITMLQDQLRLGLLTGFLAALSPYSTAYAQLSPADDLNETVLNAVGVEAMTMENIFNFTDNGTVPLQVNISLAALSYSFNSQSGATYDGLPLTVSSSGGYNSAAGEYLYTSAVSWGALSYNASGTISLDATNQETIIVPGGPNYTATVLVQSNWVGINGDPASAGTATQILLIATEPPKS